MRRILTGLIANPTYFLSIICLALFFSLFSSDLRAQSSNLKDSIPKQPELHSLRAMRLNLKAFVKNSRRDDAPQIQYAAICNLCQINLWAASDPRYHSSNILKGIRCTSANRLIALSNKLKAKEIRSSGTKNGSQNLVNESAEPKKSRVEKSDFAALKSSEPSALVSQGMGYRITNHVHNSFAGGAGQLSSHLGGQFGGLNGDNSAALITLVEATLDPDHWQSNGGPGSIHYYQPGLALVVTTTQEMQDRVRDLLLMLK